MVARSLFPLPSRSSPFLAFPRLSLPARRVPCSEYRRFREKLCKSQRHFKPVIILSLFIPATVRAVLLPRASLSFFPPPTLLQPSPSLSLSIFAPPSTTLSFSFLIFPSLRSPSPLKKLRPSLRENNRGEDYFSAMDRSPVSIASMIERRYMEGQR